MGNDYPDTHVYDVKVAVRVALAASAFSSQSRTPHRISTAYWPYWLLLKLKPRLKREDVRLIDGLVGYVSRDQVGNLIAGANAKP